MKVAKVKIQYPEVTLVLDVDLYNNPLVQLGLARHKGQAFEVTGQQAYDSIKALIPCIKDYTKRILEALSTDVFVKTNCDKFEGLSFSVEFIK